MYAILSNLEKLLQTLSTKNNGKFRLLRATVVLCAIKPYYEICLLYQFDSVVVQCIENLLCLWRTTLLLQMPSSDPTKLL